MSCSKSRQSFENKPKRTKDMKKNNKDYVWREVIGNPNLFCWIPTSLKNVKPLDRDLDQVNIQDIPPPPQDNFEDVIALLAEEAEFNRQRKNLRELMLPGVDDEKLVSVDDPKKYPIVREFIKNKGLKVYGGAAINAHLPKEAKFYSPSDIPDYDFFSTDPWNDAVELANIFKDKGYKYVEAKAGIHKGTYKVYVNLWPVADITYMPKKEFEKMKTKIIGGINVVSPLKLLENMYKEYSEPYSNPARWPKVAKREKLLSNWTQPLNKKFACSDDLFSGGEGNMNPIVANLLETCYKFIKKNKLLITGAIAYNTYMEVGGASKRLRTDHYEVLSENSDEMIKQLFTKLMKSKLLKTIHVDLEQSVSVYPAKELNYTIYTILVVINGKSKPICSLHNLNNCTPYQYIFNRYIVSVDYLKYELYNEAVFAENERDAIDAKCKLQYLETVQTKYYHDMGVSETDKTPFQRFITTCKGPFSHRLKTEIMKRWIDRLTQKAQILTEWEPGYKVKKYPRTKIPKECKNKTKEECTYPCSWNMYIGRCSGIPTGVYRPGEDDSELGLQFMD